MVQSALKAARTCAYGLLGDRISIVPKIYVSLQNLGEESEEKGSAWVPTLGVGVAETCSVSSFPSLSCCDVNKRFNR